MAQADTKKPARKNESWLNRNLPRSVSSIEGIPAAATAGLTRQASTKIKHDRKRTISTSLVP
jgi:hypothetical protein